MKIDHFDPPGNNTDFGNDTTLKQRWSKAMSDNCDLGIASVTAFLATHGGGVCQFYNPDTLVALYQQFISPTVKKSDLFASGTYNRLNRWNTANGAMHLTHPANNLFAEVFLAASATVRRKNAAGAEITASIPLINCAQF